MVGPDSSVGGQPTCYSDLLAAATSKEAGVAIACVARMRPLRGEDIPHLLGGLPPTLHVRGSPPWRRVSIVLPREAADRVCMCSHGGGLAVSRDFTSESWSSTYSHNGGCECRRRRDSRSASLKPFHEGSFRGVLARPYGN